VISAQSGPIPPADPGQCHFVALDTSSPYLLVHDPADAGKTAHYMMRWVNTRNQPGPWSETVSATIGTNCFLTNVITSGTAFYRLHHH
jgi:hypothetical protein